MTLHSCIPHIISALDASLALNESGVSVMMDLFAHDDTGPAVAYAVRVWASAKQCEIEVNPELHASVITLRGHRIAVVFQMGEAAKTVVDPEQLRAEGLL